MYEITTRTKGVERRYNKFVNYKIEKKLGQLKQNPRGKLGAHKLKGKLKSLRSCWLSADLRMTYEIDDQNKLIIVEAIGSHKIYL
jgi:addiction module RelE/StbE family toxin|tara:strand:- start:15756 stop:16010 length:255 start_codon:yes stop_codon:yes gene_type:complete